jgi:hypothetical protein
MIYLKNETNKQQKTAVRYDLYAFATEQHTTGHLIGSSTEDEMTFLFAGEDGNAARNLFDLLVRGKVTPTTMEDIAQDLCIPQVTLLRHVEVELCDTEKDPFEEKLASAKS